MRVEASLMIGEAILHLTTTVVLIIHIALLVALAATPHMRVLM